MPLEAIAAGPDRPILSAFVEDRQGRFWAGGESLYLFDGRNLIDYGRRYGIVPGELGFLALDDDDGLWLGLRTGLYRVKDGRSERLSPELFGGCLFSKGKLVLARWTHAVMESDSPLLLVDLGKLARTKQFVAEPLRVRGHGKLHLDAQGSAWFGCNTGVC